MMDYFHNGAFSGDKDDEGIRQLTAKYAVKNSAMRFVHLTAIRCTEIRAGNLCARSDEQAQ
ncbi:hypothetical protein [Pantoea stewartii]|uniref:hypothetical protein n=1 Tax=Pantoea stewartii TaxID=66269 RepID=UPI0006D02458|nr:hypothetical protein [Pantoea stewartii]